VYNGTDNQPKQRRISLKYLSYKTTNNMRQNMSCCLQLAHILYVTVCKYHNNCHRKLK